MFSESPDMPTGQGTKSDRAKGTPSLLPTFTVALLVVLAVLGVYWVLYQHEAAIKQRYLMERNFRYLAGRGENLGQVIARYEKMFQSILHGQSPSKEQVLECDPGLQPKTGTAEKPGTMEKQLGKEFCKLSHIKRVMLKKEQTDVPTFQASFIGSEVQLDYRYDSRDDSQSWLITAQVDLKGIMKPLPVEPIFGDLLLTDSQGNVVHQRRVAHHTPEYRFANLATLLKEAQRRATRIVSPLSRPSSSRFPKATRSI
ncbi:MAG: hypothetical protein OEU68_01885 [Nitrospira sp.]|nr:hypothetical protein [Nitrospira sp.]MDH4242548.1 hypothetical protein [Nitrospira sp.]MDH4355084.1 hypothetical protein [Nitrospira sp.]MDH5317825.1 hypothetical protein [Nitrospira sp.]